MIKEFHKKDNIYISIPGHSLNSVESDSLDAFMKQTDGVKFNQKHIKQNGTAVPKTIFGS